MSDANMLLTNEEVSMLKACRSEQEWNDACDKVKEARHGQYPRDWWPRMMLSGLMNEIMATWPERRRP